MPDKKIIRIMIVDDHPLFIKGLSSLIKSEPGYQITGNALNITDALTIAEKDKPHLVIVDIDLGDESGMELIPKLKSLNNEILILVVSMYDERYYSERVLRLGARGYIMKDKTTENVMDAIKTVIAGKVYLSDPERERIFEAMTGENFKGVKNWAMSLRKLSNREMQVFSLMGKGLGTIEIASRFNLSTKTIDTHKEHIKLKLHCNTSQELRQLAIEWATHPDTQ